MWKLVLVVGIAGACGRSSDTSGGGSGGSAVHPEPSPAAAAVLARVPTVDDPDVLAVADVGAPPVLVLIDDTGAIEVAAATSWGELTTRDIRTGARPVSRELVGPYLQRAHALNWKAPQIVEAAARARLVIAEAANDPEPLADDDGAEESGGIGAPPLLEEKPMTEDVRRESAARLARRDARAQSGPRGPRVIEAGNAHEPVRLARVVGEIATDGRFADDPRALILAAPGARATALIDALAPTEGMIAVAHRGAIRVLRLQFVSDTEGGSNPWWWLEVRVTARGVALEAVPDLPIDVAWISGALDVAALTAALEQVRARRDLTKRTPIDVLVEPGVDVQRLVEVLVALDRAGARMLGVGEAPAPGSVEAGLRGTRGPRVRLGGTSAHGDLDKAVLRAHVREHLPKVRVCYEAALARTPAAAGMMRVVFFIAPTGKVADAKAEGIEPAFARCVQDVVKAIMFPRPNDGAGVQVAQPFLLRN